MHDSLTEGDIVRVRSPRNHFALVDSPRYLFIAGGIGITPILPMINEAERRGADWRLTYGGRSRATMAFAGQLDHAHPGRVDIRPQDETGHLGLNTLLGTPQQDTAVYCCGPEPLLNAVAARLAVSAQTLRRRLAAEGTSFQQIRDQLRRDAAIAALATGTVSIEDISRRLGFSEPSAFHRAFKRWTGSAPRSYQPGG